MIMSKVICIMGPTASGKTALALELAKVFPVEIISVDSALVYREMDIGTAKPSADELKKNPHRLVNIIDPSESFSAGDFCRLANQHIAEILSLGRIPLLVGGTMLYFNRLLYGMGNLPLADAAIRNEINAMAAQDGWSEVHALLKQFDLESYKRIHPNDTQRIQRAIEVYRITGQSMSHLMRNNNSSFQHQAINILLEPSDRSILHKNIACRLNTMWEAGFESEVRTLKQRGDLSLSCPSMRSVGYRQVWEYLDGAYDIDTMREKALVATRQLAKRQLTWLRRWPDGSRFQIESLKSDLSSVIRYIQQGLNG